MLRTCFLNIPLSAAISGLLSSVAVAAFEPGYLTGNWVVNAQEGCGAENAEHMVIHADGAFEYTRQSKADAAGLWRIEGDVVVFDMMTAPASFQDIHAELKEFVAYETYRMRAMPIDMQQDQFSAVVSLGDQLQRFSLQRCK